jgi:type I restriction enzyme R subunit
MGINEAAFENHIVGALTAANIGYQKENTTAYSKKLAVIPDRLISFLKSTQPGAYDALFQQFGNNETDNHILQNISKEIKARGVADVMRFGVRDYGQHFTLCYNKPANNLNSEAEDLYKKNTFQVIQQLKYSERNENSIDLGIFINGIPVITAELKNPKTGQSTSDAVAQYQRDRDPNEILLSPGRCMAHFAMDTDSAKMTGVLSGSTTYFLPFNKDITNPINPNGFKTEYIWTEIWHPESLVDLVNNFVALFSDEEFSYNTATKQIEAKVVKKRIFPRYHQLRAVRNLRKETVKDGVGGRYLIQHSAGSGKSNTITWLAYALSHLWQNPADDNRMFDCVFVVTDRRVLDKQLQANIKQYANQPGLVAAIDKNKTSRDLQKAIEDKKSIIITTIQKFQVISKTVAKYPNRKYAVIIDEAHSSQGGSATREMSRAMSLTEAEHEQLEEEKGLNDVILEEIEKTGMQPNVSYYAFTATPKSKTIQLFSNYFVNGQKQAIDEYTMGQAIKEGFILDVLTNYTTYDKLYKLLKRPQVDDKLYDVKRATRLLNTYVDIQKNSIQQKSDIMLDYFMRKTSHQLDGRARAMLVTKSRLHAVKYKLYFDQKMLELNMPYKALVAFSGKVEDPDTGIIYTEESMNKLKGNVDVPMALKTPEYRILIVANKYQTGFDEPLLQTMFVDKTLGGVNTVQTLSRLNRVARGKESVNIIDFENDTEEILNDFKAYYGTNYIPEENLTDPNDLYTLLRLIEDDQIFTWAEVDEFCDILFKTKKKSERIDTILDYAVKRYINLDVMEDDYTNRERFKKRIKDFVRLYRFLTQIMPFKDVQLEKLCRYCELLSMKLPYNKESLPLSILQEVDLDSYRLKIRNENESLLIDESVGELKGQVVSEDSFTKNDRVMDRLSIIIDNLNEAKSLGLTDSDRVQIRELVARVEQAADESKIFNPNNSMQNIQEAVYKIIDEKLLDTVNNSLDFYEKMSAAHVNADLKNHVFQYFTKSRPNL